MAWCSRCRIGWREPQDEQGEHDCPRCGVWREEEEEEEDAEEEARTDT